MPQAFDYLRTIISQYANSPIILQLINNYDQYVNPSADIDDFYDLVWNVDTAQGYGLDVWGRIVGVSRTLSITAGSYLGYEEAGNTSASFGYGTWYAGLGSSSNYVLPDDSFRTLILAKALTNISDGSIPSINQLLLNLFSGMGVCYVKDSGGMQIEFVFNFYLTPVQIAIVNLVGVLPKPTGVSFTITVVPQPPTPFRMQSIDRPARKPVIRIDYMIERNLILYNRPFTPSLDALGGVPRNRPRFEAERFSNGKPLPL